MELAGAMATTINTVVDSDRKKAKVRSQISGNVEAAKQFLVVAIGLGLTNSIVEKLRYTIGASQAPVPPGDVGAAAPDPFFHFPSFVLFVFGVYAIRFFFNNYLYLHQSYSDYRLDELESEGEPLTPLVFSSGLDLGLSIFTGIIMSIISMTLMEAGQRLRYLLIFLIFHYIIDAAVLGRNILARRTEPGYGPEFSKVGLWLLFNVIFTMLFGFVLFQDVEASNYSELLLFQFTMIAWLANSVLNLLVTFFFRDKTA
jgi:hypothetical protein